VAVVTGRILPFQVNGVQVLIETVAAPAGEPASGKGTSQGLTSESRGVLADKAADGLVDAFDHAQDVIEAIATRLAGTVSSLAERAVHPDTVELEFGLSFTASGGIIVAGSSVEASLRVTIGYGQPGSV
jgi:hypothetical protein